MMILQFILYTPYLLGNREYLCKFMLSVGLLYTHGFHKIHREIDLDINTKIHGPIRYTDHRSRMGYCHIHHLHLWTNQNEIITTSYRVINEAVRKKIKKKIFESAVKLCISPAM